MNDIQIIASDLDGTLLNSRNELGTHTQNIWRRIREKGIHFMPVTGRTLLGMKSSVPYELCEYTINTNGVHIFQKIQSEPKLLLDKSMCWEDAYQVFQYSQKNFPHIQAQAFAGESLYSTVENERTAEYTSRSGISFTILKDWVELKGTRVSKIMFLHNHENLLPLAYALDTWQHVHGMFSMPMYLEVFSKNASKGHAIQHIMEILGLDASNVLGIGDSYNDISLLGVCGVSYVMKNAHEQIAPHLPRTEFDNDQDGAARLIESVIDL